MCKLWVPEFVPVPPRLRQGRWHQGPSESALALGRAETRVLIQLQGSKGLQPVADSSLSCRPREDTLGSLILSGTDLAEQFAKKALRGFAREPCDFCRVKNILHLHVPKLE